MQVTGTFNYLGINTFEGRKKPGEIYASVALLQGTAVQNIFLENDQQVDIAKIGLKQMDKVSCTLDISIGQKTYLKLVSITKAA